MNVDEALGLINGSVRELAAYHLNPDNAPVKLNQNENPFDWPDGVKEEAARFCRERPWNRYPDFIPEGLKGALAGYAGVKPENVIAGNGSNEILLVLMLSLIHSSSTVIICQPTFTVYRLLANGMGSRSVDVSLTPDLAFDIPALLAASTNNPHSLCILCSPNNPTGSVLSRDQIETILNRHAGFVLLDQAYAEFGGYNAAELIDQYPNLIVTRTFSKAFGGAGLRLGYCLGAAPVIEEINKIKLPYNINALSAHIAELMLRNRQCALQTAEELARRRDSLYAFLCTLAFDAVYPSCANFILVRTKQKEALRGHLRADGILVRDVSAYPLLNNCLRITVGSNNEDQLLRKSLAAFFAQPAAV